MDDLPKESTQIHSCFLIEIIPTSQFKMLEVGAALCKPRHYIILKWKALLLNFIKDKPFKAVVSEIKSRHKVKEIVGLTV